MGQKGHIMVQKGLKMHKKSKNRVFGPKKNCFLAEFSLAELGGTPPPLTDNHCAQKSLAERGGTPPPLTDKIRQVVFERFPKTVSRKMFCFDGVKDSYILTSI